MSTYRILGILYYNYAVTFKIKIQKIQLFMQTDDNILMQTVAGWL